MSNNQSFLSQQPKHKSSRDSSEEEFYLPQKEINPFFQRFNNRNLENEFLLSNIKQYKHTGYLLCVIQIIMMSSNFAELFKENVFPQKRMIYLLLLITLAIVIFVFLHFKQSWFNFIYSAYLTFYISMDAWYLSDTELLPDCDNTHKAAEYISFGYVISSFLALGLNGSSFIIKSILFLYGTTVVYVTQIIRSGFQAQVSVQLILIVILYVFITYGRENQLRRNFLKQKQIEQFNTIINNQIPHCLFAAKFNKNEQRIELFKCNSRAQKEFNINSPDDFERFISHTYLTNSILKRQSVSKELMQSPIKVPLIEQQSDSQRIADSKQVWENSLKGQIRQLIEQKLVLENTKQNYDDKYTENNSQKLQNHQNIQINEKSSIFKLQLRMQEGNRGDNKLSVRLSIFKLHECYVIITVDKWKKKKLQKIKETQNNIGKGNYIKIKQNFSQQMRRATQNVECSNVLLNKLSNEILSPDQRKHAPTMPNQIITSPINQPFHIIQIDNQVLLTSDALTPGSIGLNQKQTKQETNPSTEEDQIKLQTPSQFAIKNNGLQNSISNKLNQQISPLLNARKDPQQYQQNKLQTQNISQMPPCNNNSPPISAAAIFPEHVKQISLEQGIPNNIKHTSTTKGSNNLPPIKFQQNIIANEQILMAYNSYSSGSKDNVSPDSFYGSIIAQISSKKQIMAEAYLEVIGSTIDLIKRFKRHHEGFKTQSHLYQLNLLSKECDPLEQYTFSILSQILISHSNFSKFKMLQVSSKPIEPIQFKLSSILTHIQNHMQPLLIDRNIRLILQDNFESNVCSDPNSLTLILINLINYIGTQLKDSSFIAVKFSIIQNQNALKVQLTMPQWQDHPFNNLGELNSFVMNSKLSSKLFLDLRVAFALIQKLNRSTNQNIELYLQFKEKLLETENMCLQFSVPIAEYASPQTDAIHSERGQKIRQNNFSHANAAIKENGNELSPQNKKRSSVDEMQEELLLDESLNSLERWVSQKRFHSFQYPNKFKFMQ